VLKCSSEGVYVSDEEVNSLHVQERLKGVWPMMKMCINVQTTVQSLRVNPANVVIQSSPLITISDIPIIAL